MSYNNLMVFDSEEFGQVRTVVIENKEYFVAKDVALALGYSNPRDAISRHCKGVVKHDDFKEGGHAISLILEGDIYRLIVRSKLPSAERFEAWVFDEVLPQIRKTTQALQSVTYTPSDSSLVKMRDGFCYTTTNDIAEVFERQHRNVVSIVDNYLKPSEDMLESKHISTSTSDFMKTHTKETTYLDSYGREQRSYELDEYAFSMVALSFTGRKAEQFKIAFIEQFFNMRQALLERTKALAIEQVLPQEKSLRQYVYLIKNEGTKNIKIGVGQNPEQRLKQLQTGADADLTLVYKSMVCSNAFEIEAYMHKEFWHYNVRNEWFNCDKDILINELENCEYVLNSEFKIGLI